MAGRFRGELTDRFASPLYAFAAGLIGFAALGEARTTRQGRGVAIAAAVLIFVALRMLGVAVTSLAVSDLRAAILAWALPIGASALCLDSIYGGPVKRALGGARRRIAARGT